MNADTTAYDATMATVVGFGRDHVDARVQVGDVNVQGFSWDTTEMDPENAAVRLALDIGLWLSGEKKSQICS